MRFNVFLSRCLALTMYCFTRIFYRFEVSWVGEPPPDKWGHIRVFAFLNHTSLTEPLFLGAFPLSFLWDATTRTLVPGADKTMRRPLVGFFYRLFSPHTVSITRKRDDSWQHFLSLIQPQSLVALAPEGRMMRANGLDSQGKPMTVRGGIADILMACGQGRLLLGYSGGLHHVNRPGEFGIRLFQTLRIRFELLEISEYLAHFQESSPEKLRVLIARDLEARLRSYKPLAH